jgi:hypothetical protein
MSFLLHLPLQCPLGRSHQRHHHSTYHPSRCLRRLPVGHLHRQCWPRSRSLWHHWPCWGLHVEAVVLSRVGEVKASHFGEVKAPVSDA